jgi:hypothetical protein
MNLLTSKASIYRHQKGKPSKGKATEMSNEDDDRSSLFGDGFHRAASALSSRPSISRRFRPSHDFAKEESVTEKFKREVNILLLPRAELLFITFLQAEHLKSKREYQAAADKYARPRSLLVPNQWLIFSQVLPGYKTRPRRYTAMARPVRLMPCGPQFRHVYLTLYHEQGSLPFASPEVNSQAYMSILLILMFSQIRGGRLRLPEGSPNRPHQCPGMGLCCRSIRYVRIALFHCVDTPPLICVDSPLRLEQWIVSFEAYDKALALLKKQEIPDDNLRGKLQLSYSEAKKKAKQVILVTLLPSFYCILRQTYLAKNNCLFSCGQRLSSNEAMVTGYPYRGEA